MKKQIKKLSLNKKTISNLQPMEMNKKVGGGSYYGSACGSAYCPHQSKNNCTQKNTCADHNTCYNC